MKKEEILIAKAKRVLFLPHAIKQMSRLDRMITTEEVNNVVEYGDVIEEYPADERGQSCLISYVNDRPVHVVCAAKNNYLAIITAYVPDETLWLNNYSERKK